MFEEAYPLASDLRARLQEEGEITTTELRAAMVELLEERGFHEIAEHYEKPRNERVSVYVRDREDGLLPFSKGRLVQSLEVCAEERESLYTVAAAVERHLLAEGISDIGTLELTALTFRFLEESHGLKVAKRYLRWQEFTDTDRPLVLLVGGVTGTGKSTIASLVAHRLGIIRTQSTDMLREVMRGMIPKRLLPPLHESSFTAYRALPRWDSEGKRHAPQMVDGFLIQAEEVAVGIEGVFRRALRERVSLVIEGVHMHPRLQRSLMTAGNAVVVPLILATTKKKALHRHLRGRGLETPSRRAERYLDNFEQIWELQTFLLSEADEYDIPIITERDPDEMVRRVIRVIADRLKQDYAGDPAELFAELPDQEEPTQP